MAINTLQDTINYVVPFCRYQAANIGTSNMPMVGIASVVRNIILAAPFQWRFNRNVNSDIDTVKGTQDYNEAISDFGFLEKATLTDVQGKIWEIKDIKNNEPLAVSTTEARPQSVAVEGDDGAGNLVFRFSAVPEAVYEVGLIYQKSPVKFTATTDSWGPIPDSFSDVYNNLCLGYYMDSCQDGRAPQYIARGIAGLLARSQGLSAMDKALFAQSYMNFNMQEILNQLKTQQGQQAQGAR